MNKNTNIMPKEKKRLGPRLFQLFVVVAFLALVWFSFGKNVLLPLNETSMPEQLGNLELVSSVEGSEALGQVSQLHGTDINLVEANIASYSRGNERVTVWIGRTESSDAAAELTNRMIAGISRGNSDFSRLKKLTVSQGYHNHEVFQVEGPGGQHFFYISRKHEESVIWLSIEASEPLSILEQAVDSF